jgi:hypothetical protein
MIYRARFTPTKKAWQSFIGYPVRFQHSNGIPKSFCQRRPEVHIKCEQNSDLRCLLHDILQSPSFTFGERTTLDNINGVALIGGVVLVVSVVARAPLNKLVISFMTNRSCNFDGDGFVHFIGSHQSTKYATESSI